MTQAPLVSVIMNCYQGERYLTAAIDSVLAQSYEHWEIIFWDNQSTDGSAAIVKSYTDSRIKYFQGTVHTLLSEARNCALEKADGDIIAFLDVDDIWLPLKLERQVALFSDPQVGLVCGNYWVISGAEEKRRLASRVTLPNGFVLDDLLRFYFVGLVTLVIRREALQSVGHAFDVRYHIIGDLDLVMRLSVAWKLASVQEPVAIYRMHGNNESTKKRDKHAAELDQWSSEMQNLPAFKESRSTNFIRSHFAYVKAMNFALLGDKVGAYHLLKLIPWGRLKLRVWAAVLLPRWIVQRLKN